MPQALLAQNPNFTAKHTFRRKAFVTQNSESSSAAYSRSSTPILPRPRSYRQEIVIPRPLRSISRGFHDKYGYLNSFQNVYYNAIPAADYSVRNYAYVDDYSELGRFILQRRQRRASTQILTRQNPNEVIKEQRTDMQVTTLTGDVGRCDAQILAFLQRNSGYK